jgi:hypothetical protein
VPFSNKAFLFPSICEFISSIKIPAWSSTHFTDKQSTATLRLRLYQNRASDYQTHMCAPNINHKKLNRTRWPLLTYGALSPRWKDATTLPPKFTETLGSIMHTQIASCIFLSPQNIQAVAQSKQKIKPTADYCSYHGLGMHLFRNLSEIESNFASDHWPKPYVNLHPNGRNRG